VGEAEKFLVNHHAAAQIPNPKAVGLPECVTADGAARRERTHDFLQRPVPSGTNPLLNMYACSWTVEQNSLLILIEGSMIQV